LDAEQPTVGADEVVVVNPRSSSEGTGLKLMAPSPLKKGRLMLTKMLLLLCGLTQIPLGIGSIERHVCLLSRKLSCEVEEV
jgi:hypothetical protein